MKKLKGLDKVLKKHLDHCKMWEFHLREDRHCTCGVELGREQLQNYQYLATIARDVNEWLKRTDREETAHQRSLQEALDKIK